MEDEGGDEDEGDGEWEAFCAENPDDINCFDEDGDEGEGDEGDEGEGDD